MSRIERHGILRVSPSGHGSACGPALAAAPTAGTASSRSGSHRRTGGVALVDEFPLRRASTLNLLRTHVREGALPFSSVDELLDQMSTKAQALCCVVMCVGGRSVVEAPLAKQLRSLCSALGSTPVIILSDREEPDEAIAAFRQGVRGYIPTSLKPSLAVEALRIVLAGGTFVPADALIRSRRRVLPAAIEGLPCPSELAAEHREKWPPRQFAVLLMLAQGKANKEIARALTMEEATVKIHVRQIISKLGVSNRTQAALYARRQGFTAADDGAVASIGSASRPSVSTTDEGSDENEAPASPPRSVLSITQTGGCAAAPGGANPGAPHR